VPVRLIVGLGNPGGEYERTRHNLGFRVVDALAAEAGVPAWRTRCRSMLGSAQISGREVFLAKPLTFMNLSGRAVALLLGELALEPADLVVVFDDLNLPLGKIRIRERGSAGGHNGMESVLRAVESHEVARVRLGIGEETMAEDKAGFVLSGFPADREAEVKEMVVRGREAVQVILHSGVPHAMSIFNAA